MASSTGERIILCVTGGRKWRDYAYVHRILHAINQRRPIDALIHGEATGWDELCERWAIVTGIPIISERAHWEDLSYPDARIKKRDDGSKYDANAGARRNGWLLDYKPDYLLAGPGGYGTANMVQQAQARNIPIWFARP